MAPTFTVLATPVDAESLYDARVDATELLADLDPDQRAAVETGSNLVAVIAGAGSGKTRVLTRRIAYRFATQTADPQHTLALTFTREAAGELRRRLQRLGFREAVEAGTFHSVMWHVLRQRWADRRAPKSIISDRRRYLNEVIGDDRGAARRAHIAIAEKEIAWAATRGIRASDYAVHARRSGRRPTGGVDRIVDWYTGFERLKRRRGVIDFDDVLSLTLAEARRDHDFADALRWRFRHIHVDEAQDLNPVQHAIVDLLRDGRDDLFLVGDPAQAIFGFNGADPALLTELETRFPGVEVIRLPVNHRCTPQIVSVGGHVLDVSGQPAVRRSARPDGPTVEILSSDDEHVEAERIAQLIVRGDPAIVASSNVAVLARTNAQLALIETALTRRHIAVRRSIGGAGSPIQAAVRQASAQSSPNALRGWAHDVLDDVGTLTAAREAVAALEATESRPRRERALLMALAEAGDHLARIRAERSVATALLVFLRDQPRGDGGAFRSWVATTSPFGRDDDGGVELLSFHAAKGREWHSVIVSGAETGLVPHKSATTATARAEEARLLYVAVSRATDRLTVTYAGRRGGYERRPTPLLDGFDLSEPALIPPPRELIRRAQPVESIALIALRAWRTEAAQRASILPTELCSDRDLVCIANHRPQNAGELAEATSMGPMTAERLAPEVLPLVSPKVSDG